MTAKRKKPQVRNPPEPKPEVEVPRFVRRQVELAEAFEVSTRTIRNWLTAGAPERTPDGYDLEAWRSWVQARRDFDGVGGEDSEALADAKLRRARADATKAELDAKLRARQLELLEDGWHSDDAVREEFASRLQIVRQGLLLLPRSAARDAVGMTKVAEVETVLERHVHQLLEDFASVNVVELLRERRRRAEAGTNLGRGRGRPRGAKARAPKGAGSP